MEHDPTNAVLAAREDLTATLSIVRIRPDSGSVPPFTPGQFVRLGLPRPPLPGDRPGRIRYSRRAYSIASSAHVTDHLEFLVVRVESGELTPRLWEIEVGGRLWLDPEAKGEFTLDAAPLGRDLVMLATGTGIAPFMSMLRTYAGQGRWRRCILIHGVRRVADLGYRAELELLAQTDPTVCYVPTVTREPHGSAWTGLRSRVHAMLDTETFARLAGTPLDPAHCHVFLCGGPAMIDDVEKMLAPRGFTADSRAGRGNLHFERYW